MYISIYNECIYLYIICMFEYTSALKVMSKYLFKRFFYILDNLDLFSLPHFLFFFLKNLIHYLLLLKKVKSLTPGWQISNTWKHESSIHQEQNLVYLVKSHNKGSSSMKIKLACLDLENYLLNIGFNLLASPRGQS